MVEAGAVPSVVFAKLDACFASTVGQGADGSGITSAGVTIGTQTAVGRVVHFAVAIVVFSVADLGRWQALIAASPPSILIGTRLYACSALSHARGCGISSKAWSLFAFV